MLEVKPDTPSHAISIIEADVMVDFAPSEDQLKKGTYSKAPSRTVGQRLID